MRGKRLELSTEEVELMLKVLNQIPWIEGADYRLIASLIAKLETYREILRSVEVRAEGRS